MAQYKPVLIILDPLYLMFDGDINSAKDLAPVLQWLLEIRYKLDCGIMLIHHYNKGGAHAEAKRGGQRMLGSTTLHGWIESAWYVRTEATEVNGEDINPDDVNSERAEAGVIIEREFRGAGLHPKADLTITMGKIGGYEYNVETKVHIENKNKVGKVENDPKIVERDVWVILGQNTHSLSAEEICALSGHSVKAVNNAVDALAHKGKVKRIKRKIRKIIQ